MLVPDRLILSISENADLLGFFTYNSTYLGFTENGPKKRKYIVSSSSVGENYSGQRRMAKLVWADRKATVTQQSTHYHWGMQRSISEHWTLKQTGYRSRRPHRVSLLSAKNRKLKLQLKATKKVAWSDKSWIVLQIEPKSLRNVSSTLLIYAT